MTITRRHGEQKGGALGEPSQITHVEDALTVLVDRWKNRPVFAAVLSSFISRIDEIESDAFTEYATKWAMTGAGKTLDDTAAFFGITRASGESDVDLEYRILTAQAIARSDGTRADIIDVIDLAGAGAIVPDDVRDYGEATVRIDIGPVGSFTVADLFTVMYAVRKAKPAGVTVLIYMRTTTVDDTFRFDDYYVPLSPSPLAFDHTTLGGSGGEMAAVVKG